MLKFREKKRKKRKMTKEISRLKNNIEYIYKKNDNTPRMAICLAFSVNDSEKYAGIGSMLSRLMLQGTKKYNSEQLANEFEKYAIDFSCDLYPNYLRFKCVCLNEDFPKALELMNEVITNTTFEEFEKEKVKLKGEITADLDSARAKCMDAYCRTMFAGHYYGNSMTVVLENIDNVTKEDVIETYNRILTNSKKYLAVVGALDKAEIMPQLEETFGNLLESVDTSFNIEEPVLNEKKEVEIIKSDLNQAHILKGWKVPTLGDDEHTALILLNIILGSSGLSSRLFLELRDKKGLAYVVRSSYETLKLAGNFAIYIATEPKNIEVSLKGFDEEIEKIKSIPVSEEELNNAKNNLIGKCAFITETNIQQACSYVKYGVMDLGFEFAAELKEKIKAVTPEQIQKCAQKAFNDKYVLSIVKP